MAGPACSVFLPQAKRVDALIDELIALLGAYRESEDFWVTSTESIGGCYLGEARPFSATLACFGASCQSLGNSSLDTACLVQALGWSPQCEVTLIAMCNGKQEHRILAELALWLTVRTKGVVDFDDEVPEVHALGAWALRVPYCVERGHTEYTTLTDATGLRRWMAHPSFRMVK